MQIASLLRSLGWRERGILLGGALIQGVWVGWAALAILVVAPVTGATRPGALSAVILVLGVGSFAAVVWPLLRGWKTASDPVRQAHAVERLVPALRGRLVASAERLSGPVGQESRALLDFTAGRAATVAASVRPSAIHPVGGLVVRALVAGFLWAILPLMALLVPLGPIGTWEWWTADASVAQIAAPSIVAGAPTARVGDLVLRYVYPAYTGLDPKEIPNSTGEAHAPAGTRVDVRARSADALESAAVSAYDLPPESATVDDGGRAIAGSFGVGKDPGKWRIIAFRGGVSTPSRDFDIVPEPDLPPDVTLDASGDRIEVGVDERIPLRWHARDDFGVRRVIFEVDGKEVGAVLASPAERRADLNGDGAPSPQELGLQEGDRVRLAVAAWDNDAVSGSKRGVSRAVLLVVGGGDADMTAGRRQALMHVFVDMLAGHLEERWPPGRSNAEFRKWGSELSHRYEPLDRFVEEDLGGRLPSGIVGDAIRHVRRSGGQLIRYVHTTFQEGDVLPADTDVAVASTLRDQSTTTLENEILVLDFLLRKDALEDILAAADRLGASANDAKEALKQPMSAADISSTTDRLERRLEKLRSESKKLNDKGIGDLIESRSIEMQALDNELQAALRKNDMVEANELMKRLANQMGDLANAISDSMGTSQKKDDQAIQEAKDLLQRLDDLQKDQQALHDEVRAAREKFDAANADKIEQLWRKAEEKAAQNRSAAQAVEQETTDGTVARQFAQDGSDQAADLEDAIRNRDLHRARSGIDESRYAAELMDRFGDHHAGSAAQNRLDQLERQLDELDRASDQEGSLTRQSLKGMQQRQDDLAQRLGQAKKDAATVGQTLPIQPQGMDEGLQEAQDGMKQAGDDIRSGKPMQAEGSQSSARQGVSDAEDALREAMKRSQSPSGSGKKTDKQDKSSGKKKGDSGAGDENSGQDQGDEEPTFIPVPDAFRTPEEYRKELLDGMEGEVPEEYRALKKRYYEELVHQ
jgi:hypothetical protein